MDFLMCGNLMFVIVFQMAFHTPESRLQCEKSTNQTYLVRKENAPSFCRCRSELSVGCSLLDNEYPDYYSCDGLNVYDRIQCCEYKRLVKCCSGWTKLYESCSIPVCNPPCMNGGYCVAPQVCRCIRGYIGTTCQTPVCNPPCDNMGLCVSPSVCSCQAGYTGSSCSRGICHPSCLNGGQCVAPQVCQCPPGFYGILCEKGFLNVYEPILQLANESKMSFASWYRIASPYSKACFVKLFIQINLTNIVTFTSTSFDGQGNLLGNYTTVAVDEINSVRGTLRSVCLNVKCPEDKKDLNTTKVITRANMQCNITTFDPETSRALAGNVLETDLKSGNDYGPLYGIYTAYGSSLSSRAIAEKMCQMGSNYIENDESFSPSRHPNAVFMC